MISLAHGRERPAPHELLSIQERARYLFALRVVLAAAAVASALSDPRQLAVAPSVIALGSVGYQAKCADMR